MSRQTLYTFAANAATAQFTTAEGDITVRFSDLSDDIRHALMVHGLKQKIADAAAIPRDTETGRSATDAEKLAAMRAVAARINAGEWAARAGDGSSAPRSLLQRALERLYPTKAPEAIAAYVAGLTKQEQSALRMSPKVAPTIAGLKAESARATTLDTDALLDGLM